MLLSKWDSLTQMALAIETPRLLLRRPEQTDALVLRDLWRDERVQHFMGGILSQQEADARVADILQSWQDHKAGLWAVCERENNRPIGLRGLGIFEAEIEIIYKFFPIYWGRGYATEAVNASLTYGFQMLQIDRIIGVTQEANYVSWHILEKVGMHHIHNLWKWDAPQRVYVLTRVEWLA